MQGTLKVGGREGDKEGEGEVETRSRERIDDNSFLYLMCLTFSAESK